MAYLSVNVDYVALIRQARRTDEPDPAVAAGIVELAGAQGITAHLREDRRHIVDRDIRVLKEVVRLPFNLEMAATDEMLSIATEIVPDQVTLVPEKREEITTEGGLDVLTNRERLTRAVDILNTRGIKTSLFIDPDLRQLQISRVVGAQCVELHTGEYANAKRAEERLVHLEELRKSAEFARRIGLEVHAGHGLTYRNIRPVCEIGDIEGFYIGHSIMARAIYAGLDRAVKEMIHLIHNY